jgi:hypothetical protein
MGRVQEATDMSPHRKLRERSKTWSVLLAVALAALCCVMSASGAYSDALVRPQDFRTMAVFELVVSGSKVLRSGPSKIVTESAFVTLTHTLMGNTDGLEIQFFTKPITDAARADILENGAKELRRNDHAALVLFLDKNHQVWQVNLSYVVPGTTVARTVAWKPEDLRQFSNYKFDGKRLLLKSKGLYNESGEEQLKLSWVVDLDLPVFERIKK